MAINQNSPFTRQYVDLPTPLAILMDDPKARGGKTKKQFVADAIEAALPSDMVKKVTDDVKKGGKSK